MTFLKSANIRAFFIRIFSNSLCVNCLLTQFNYKAHSALAGTNTRTPYSRLNILQSISLVMIGIIILQSGKLIPLLLNMQNKAIIYLHIANVTVHLVCFISIAILFMRGYLRVARQALFICFSTYLSVACILWQANVNLQYYFLLAMFISSYVFSDKENRYGLFWSITQLSLFIVASISLPSIHQVQTYTPGDLIHIRYVNVISFAFACGLCAIFIKRIIEANWRKIKDFERKQNALLKKVFPEHLAHTLIDKTQGQLQQHNQLGVLFLDICNFTHYAMSSQQKGLSSWPKIYQLFAQFDQVLAELDVSRIKVNGDQYILLIGANSLHQTHHFIAQQALQCVKMLMQKATFNVKIGLAFGEVTYGVFDPAHPQFDIWGETVIRAARLEALAKPNCAIFDSEMQNLLSRNAEFACEKVLLKGISYQYVYHFKHKNSSDE